MNGCSTAVISMGLLHNIVPNFVRFGIMGRLASQFFPLFAAAPSAAVLPAEPDVRRVALGALNQQCRRSDGRYGEENNL